MQCTQCDAQLRLPPGLLLALAAAIPPQIAVGHGIPVPWLQPGGVDENGVYISFDGPTKIRKLGPVTLSVMVLNAEGHADVIVDEIDVVDASGHLLRSTKPQQLLPSQAERVQALRTSLSAALPRAVESKPESAIAAQVLASAFTWQISLEEQELALLFGPTGEAEVRAIAAIRFGDVTSRVRTALIISREEVASIPV